MRFRDPLHDGAIFLGIFLLLFSLFGLLTEPSNLPGFGSPEGVQNDARDVTLVATLVIPTPVTPRAPTLTPFQAYANNRQKSVLGAYQPTRTAEPKKDTTLEDLGLVTPVPGDSSFLAPLIPQSTQTPPLPPLVPDRLVIPAIQVDAPIHPAAYALVEIKGQVFQQWEAPNEYAAGWQSPGTFLGAPGNTVLNGHHNIDGMVFGRLVDLAEGDIIEVYSGSTMLTYKISNKMILPERYESISVRLENARWLMPSTDERLTLVTCWPPESNTYRLIIVARPFK